MKDIKVITIDFWETLFFHTGTPDYRNTIRISSISKYLNKSGFEISENISETFFKTVDDYVKLCWSKDKCPSRNDIIDYSFKFYNEALSKHDINDLLDIINDLYVNELIPDLVDSGLEFVQWVSNNFSVYLISDTFTLTSEVLDKILIRYGLMKYFKARFYSDKIGVQKPNPSVIKNILEIENISSSQILHIGDLVEKDAELSRNSKCNCIIVNAKKKLNLIDNNYLGNQSIFHVCNSLEQAKDILNGFIN